MTTSYISPNSDSLIEDTTASKTPGERVICGVIVCSHCRRVFEDHIEGKCLYDALFFSPQPRLFPSYYMSVQDVVEVSVEVR